MEHPTRELYLRDMIWGGVWGALALVLPLIFHPLGLGIHLMPMFAPLLVAALTLHVQTSLILCLIVPLLSSFLTGMPPLFPPIAFLMITELVAMTAWTAWGYRRKRWNVYAVLILAFVVQRAVRVLFIFAVGMVFELPGNWMLAPALLWGLPGAVIQVILLPGLIGMLKKEGYGEM